MNLALPKNLNVKVTPRAAATAIGLVLLASVVVGRESASRVEAIAEPVEASAPRAARPTLEATADLDIAKLHRPSHEHAPGELFAARMKPAAPTGEAPQMAEAAPPPAPTAPALPFHYLGKLIQEGKLRVFLSNGDALHTVQSGETLENLYKVELVTEEMVTFTYLPLGTVQTLAIAAPS